MSYAKEVGFQVIRVVFKDLQEPYVRSVIFIILEVMEIMHNMMIIARFVN